LPLSAESLLRSEGIYWSHAAGLIALLSAVAIGVRFLWIFTATYGVRWLVPSIQARDPASARVSTLVSWSGMRGVVSLAAAIALPVVLPSGEPFPERDLVILLTFGIVFVTLVGQGLTLPPLVRGLRIESDPSGEAEFRLAREAMRRGAVKAVNRMVAEDGVPAHEAVAVKRFFNSRSQSSSSSVLSPDSETRLWLGAAAAQRTALLELWRNGEIGDDVLIRLEREIDLAEARLARDD
jgi:CPA1 family monovalent cation:H+ antiporter